MTKLVSIGTSKCQLRLNYAIENWGKDAGVEIHDIKLLPDDGRLLSFDDLWHLQNCDAYVMWGTWGSAHTDRQYRPGFKKRQAWGEFLNRFAVNLSKAYDKKILLFETPTLSRIRTLYTEEKNYKLTGERYYRLGLNHWTYGRAKWCRPAQEDRLKKLIDKCPDITNIYKHQWKNNKDGCILILPGLEHDPTSTIPVDKFVINSISSIRQVTKRKVVVKPHPLSSIDYRKILEKVANVTVEDKTTTLDMLLPDTYCAVIDSSTSIFELINLGIPCITSKYSFGYSLDNSNLSKIENLHYANSDDVLKWYHHMSYTEFTYSEISSEYIFDKIKELIR